MKKIYDIIGHEGGHSTSLTNWDALALHTPLVKVTSKTPGYTKDEVKYFRTPAEIYERIKHFKLNGIDIKGNGLDQWFKQFDYKKTPSMKLMEMHQLIDEGVWNKPIQEWIKKTIDLVNNRKVNPTDLNQSYIS